MRRVAVSQRVDPWPARGERRDALDQRLCLWLSVNHCWPLPIPNGLPDVPAWLAAMGIDAIVLSGGNDIGAAPERDATERALLDHARTHGLPLLGICRGMQMMAVWAGGRLRAVSGHVGTRHRLPGPIAQDVNSYHQLGLVDCPPGYTATALSDDGSIEAMAHQRLPWQGWMWHPEREADFSPHDNTRLQALFGLPHMER